LLLAAMQAARSGHALYVPGPNLPEVRLAGHAEACGVEHLRELQRRFDEPLGEPPVTEEIVDAADVSAVPGEGAPLSDVIGQWHAKRALVVAAAGGHSLLMVGPPGSGKSMLAARLPGLLPPLSRAEALEVASIASIGTPGLDPSKWRKRPFRSPHHTASAHAIVGGGPRIRPGEISLAHRGVLFLDELPEFDRRVLESLREPLETGVITIARASARLELPAQFQLVAAMNPCPCGYLSDPAGECRCTPPRIERYRSKISGPLLDRIDIRIEMPRVRAADLPAQPLDDTTDVIGRIREARARQLARAGCVNARLAVGQLQECCPLAPPAARLLERSRDGLMLSGRGIHRLLRVSRTIADLDGSAAIGPAHLAEALQLRRALLT